MPATSDRQRRFMMAEIARRRSGKKAKTGMSEDQLKEFGRVAEHRRVRKALKKKTPPAY